MDWIETHGTGTSLGDPIEVSAIIATLQHKSDPLQLGAAKTVLGHLEAVAGAAGLIKSISMLQGYVLYPNLHLKVLNSNISPSDLSFSASTQRVAAVGVSSFGMSGTNVHGTLAKRGSSSFGMSGTNSNVVETSAVNGDCNIQFAQLSEYREQSVVQYNHTMFAWFGQQPAHAKQQLQTTGPADTTPSTTWEREWSSAFCCVLAHHRVGHTPVAPMTGFLNMAHEAVSVGPSLQLLVAVVKAQYPAMLFVDDPHIMVKVCTERSSSTQNLVRIESCIRGGEWVLHAAVTTKQLQPAGVADQQAPSCTGIQCSTIMDDEIFYNSIGNDYRGLFRSVAVVWLVDLPTGIRMGAKLKSSDLLEPPPLVSSCSLEPVFSCTLCGCAAFDSGVVTGTGT